MEYLQHLKGKPVDLTSWSDGLAVACNNALYLVHTSNQDIQELSLAKGESLYAISSTPEGEHLYAVGEKGLYCWKRDSGELVFQDKNSNYVDSLAIHPNEEWLLCGSEMSVRILNTHDRSLHLERKATSYSDEARSGVAWIPNSDNYACINVNKLTWHSSEPKQKKRLGKVGFRQYSGFQTLVVSPDGAQVAAMADPMGGSDGFRVYVWSFDDEKRLAHRHWKDGSETYPTSIAYTPDSSTLITVGHPKDKDWISFWDTSTFKPKPHNLTHPEKYPPEIYKLCVDPTGNRLFALCEGGNSTTSSVLSWEL